MAYKNLHMFSKNYSGRPINSRWQFILCESSTLGFQQMHRSQNKNKKLKTHKTLTMAPFDDAS